jgi:hypothetical protein
VDGNHRLALAGTLADDSSVPTKYLASFCLVLLGRVDERADDYSESLIFHTINSKAMPLESEHALKLILGQSPGYDMPPEEEIVFSPELHFTRLMRDGLLGLPEPARSRIGQQPLTSLSAAAKGILEMETALHEDLNRLRQYAADLMAALDDLVTRLAPDHPELCSADFFIELAARVWRDTPPEASHQERVDAAVGELSQLAIWLGHDGLVRLNQTSSLSTQVLEMFAAVRSRVPKRIFLARWYPAASDGEELARADLRLGQVREVIRQLSEDDGIPLELIDMGTQAGGTFPIHSAMYEALLSSDVVLIDLTGVRPNVCVEAGFALRHLEKNRLIFMFQPVPGHESVPFDLNTFRYERFTDTGEIVAKLKPHLLEILRGASVGE